MSYVHGDFEDPSSTTAFALRSPKLTKTHGTQGNVVFYLAVAAQFFGPVIEHLHAGRADRSAGEQDGSVATGAGW